MRNIFEAPEINIISLDTGTDVMATSINIAQPNVNLKGWEDTIAEGYDIWKGFNAE